MNPFELFFENKDGTKVHLIKCIEPVSIGKISELRALKQLEQSTSIDFRKEISFSFEVKPTKEFEDYFRYLTYKTWNTEILDRLHFICTADRYKPPRSDTRGETILFLLYFMDTSKHLNSYLSEYQYLNPLF